MANPTLASARIIESTIVVIQSHLEDANASVSRGNAVKGCEQLAKAIRAANMIRDYMFQSDHINAPVVRQQMTRLAAVHNTLEDIAELQGWGDKCKRYLDKKRKRGTNYENVSFDIIGGVRRMRDFR